MPAYSVCLLCSKLCWHNSLAGPRGQATKVLSYRKNSPLVSSLEGGLSLGRVEGNDDGDLRSVLECYVNVLTAHKGKQCISMNAGETWLWSGNFQGYTCTYND